MSDIHHLLSATTRSFRAQNGFLCVCTIRIGITRQRWRPYITYHSLKVLLFDTVRKIFIHVLTKFIDKLKHLNEYYILYCLRYWCCIYTDTIHYPQIKRNIRYLIIRRSNIDCLIKIYTVVLPASHMNGYGRITIFNVNFSVFQQWPTHGRNQHSKCQASDPEYI